MYLPIRSFLRPIPTILSGLIPVVHNSAASCLHRIYRYREDILSGRLRIHCLRARLLSLLLGNIGSRSKPIGEMENICSGTVGTARRGAFLYNRATPFPKPASTASNYTVSKGRRLG